MHCWTILTEWLSHNSGVHMIKCSCTGNVQNQWLRRWIKWQLFYHYLDEHVILNAQLHKFLCHIQVSTRVQCHEFHVISSYLAVQQLCTIFHTLEMPCSVCYTHRYTSKWNINRVPLILGTGWWCNLELTGIIRSLQIHVIINNICLHSAATCTSD